MPSIFGHHSFITTITTITDVLLRIRVTCYQGQAIFFGLVMTHCLQVIKVSSAIHRPTMPSPSLIFTPIKGITVLCIIYQVSHFAAISEIF